MRLTLPKPTASETQPDFVKRFINDAAIADAPLSDLERSQLADLAWTRREHAVELKSWPKRYECRFIEPGLVRYANHGTILVTKDALDRMANSYVGKPVIDEMHRDASPEDYKNGKADGIVTRVFWNAADGWYCAEFMVWNPIAQKHCENGAYSVSCAYDTTETTAKKGLHNNIPYDHEVVDGVYNHLAIVANPRYERARIAVCNSTEGENMKLFFWQKDKKEMRNSIDETATIEIDGVRVPLKDAVTKVQAAPAPKVENDLKDDTEIEVDGVSMTVADFKAKYRNAVKAENEAADADKKKALDKDHDDEKHKESPFENCLKCQNAKAEATRLKNEADAVAKKAKDELDAKAREAHFKALNDAGQHRGLPQGPVKIMDREARIAIGKERYGSAESK